MTIYELKPKFQNLLRPVVKWLFKLGVTANQITILACVVSIFVAILLIKFSHIAILFWLLPVWLFFRMALNAIDGMLAREFNQKSALGGYLNEITDVVSDTMLYLPFAFIAPFDFGLIFTIIWLSVMSEFVGVLGLKRRYDGPMGKSDRAFVFSIFGVIYATFSYLPFWFKYAAYCVIVLLLLTCFNRVKFGLKEMK